MSQMVRQTKQKTFTFTRGYSSLRSTSGVVLRIAHFEGVSTAAGLCTYVRSSNVDQQRQQTADGKMGYMQPYSSSMHVPAENHGEPNTTDSSTRRVCRRGLPTTYAATLAICFGVLDGYLFVSRGRTADISSSSSRGCVREPEGLTRGLEMGLGARNVEMQKLFEK